jgi:exodeoxyribonuclease VII large subunit
MRSRTRAAIGHRVDRERAGLVSIRSRPVLAAPLTMIESREDAVTRLVDAARHRFERVLLDAESNVHRLGAQVRALSPAATLERGYAVVQGPDGGVVRSPADVQAGDVLRIRLAEDEIAATTT